MTQRPLYLQQHGLFSAHPWRPGRLWAARLLPVTSTALTHVQGEAMQLCLRCSVHATLPRAGAVHDAAHLLRRNAMLQFNSLSSKCSLNGDRRGEERVPLLHVTTLQVGNQAAAGGQGAAAPWGTGLFSSRQP